MQNMYQVHILHLATAVMLAMLAFTTPAFAATELAVVDSAPVAGEAAAPTSGRYWVQFANNVAAVESNADCVSLLDPSGKEVPANKCKVSLPDVELEFGYRQYVWLDVTGLDAGTTYTIHVDGALSAKNGSVLGQDAEIAFTTAAEGEKAAALAEPTETAGGSGGGQGNGEGSSVANDSGDVEVVDLTPRKEAASDPIPVQVMAMSAVILLVVVVMLIIRIRKARKM